MNTASSLERNLKKLYIQPTLKSNLRIGEKVLKEIRQEFPFLRSATFVHAKIEKLKINPNFEKIKVQSNRLESRYNEGVFVTRSQLSEDMDCFEFVRKSKEVYESQNFANCGENSFLAFVGLYKHDQKPTVLTLEVQKRFLGIFYIKMPDKNHQFPIFGLKKGAKISNPATWGEKAVVVDPWVNIVMPAKEALEYLKDFLGVKEGNRVVFKELK